MADEELRTLNSEDTSNAVNGEDHDPHYEPIISLPEVATLTNEEDEVELIKLRAKLYRYDTTEDPPEWKERGTGDVKLLHHQIKNTVRVVMRRDKTLKICANHFVTPTMELKPNCGSDRAWVWSTLADFTTEIMHPELLAIRFANPENAKKWKDKFEESKTIVGLHCDLYKEGGQGIKENETDSSEFEDQSELEDSLRDLKLSGSKSGESESGEKTSEHSESNKATSQTEDLPEK